MPDSRDREFVQLFQEHYERIYNLCRRICLDDAAAQDITQDVFIKVYTGLDTFRGESKVFTWIYSIAAHHALDHVRREKRWYRKLSSLFDGRRCAQTDLPEKVADREAGLDVLAGLSPTNRTMLVLRLYLDLDYREIASVMGLTVASVGVQLTRARKEALKVARKIGIVQ